MSLAIKIKDGKFDRIPQRYSEELQRVICWMLTKEQPSRATIDDLINLPLVSIRLREKRFEEKQQIHYQLLKKKEQEIQKREDKIGKREKTIQEQERILATMEKTLNNKEQDIIKKEQMVKQMQQDVEDRTTALQELER